MGEEQQKYDGGEIPPAPPEVVERVKREGGGRRAEESVEETPAPELVDPQTTDEVN